MKKFYATKKYRIDAWLDMSQWKIDLREENKNFCDESFGIHRPPFSHEELRFIQWTNTDRSVSCRNTDASV